MYHYPVHAGTGGHYEMNGVLGDEFSGSSYLSSASKRQRVEEAYKGGGVPEPHLLLSQSVPMLPEGKVGQ